MPSKLVMIAAAALSVLGASFALGPGSDLQLVPPAWAACEPGTVIDKTTVEATRDRLLKAGYKNPLHLRKGCDNTWHGEAIKDGAEINVAVLSNGRIVRDGE